jgi:hypothetical protein
MNCKKRIQFSKFELKKVGKLSPRHIIQFSKVTPNKKISAPDMSRMLFFFANPTQNTFLNPG